MNGRDDYEEERRRSRSQSPYKDHRPRSQSPKRRPQHSEQNEENPGSTLFVTTLSQRTREEQLEEVFSQYGKVEKINLLYDPHTRDSRGFGFVKMSQVEEADRALDALNGFELDGKCITVQKAKRSRPRSPTPGYYKGEIKPRPGMRAPPRYIDRYPGPPRDHPYRYEPRGPRYDDQYDRRYDDRYDHRPPPPPHDYRDSEYRHYDSRDRHHGGGRYGGYEPRDTRRYDEPREAQRENGGRYNDRYQPQSKGEEY